MAYTVVTGIYAIRNPKRTAVYYGSAVCIKGRLNGHKRELRKRIHRNHLLQRMYDKHQDKVIFEVVEECSRDDLRLIEQKYIDNEQGVLLNLEKKVCELAPSEVHTKRMKKAWSKRTEAQKKAMSQKISETLKRRYRENPEALEKARKSLEKGRSSKALKQNKISAEANEKRRKAAKAQWAKRTDEERKTLSEKISKRTREGMAQKKIT